MGPRRRERNEFLRRSFQHWAKWVSAKMTEAEIHKAVVSQMRYRGHRELWAWHTLNLPKYNGYGILPGVSDLILVYGGKTHALELKTEKGKASTAQVRFQQGMADNGWETAIVHGLDEAIAKIEEWGLVR